MRRLVLSFILVVATVFLSTPTQQASEYFVVFYLVFFWVGLQSSEYKLLIDASIDL